MDNINNLRETRKKVGPRQSYMKQIMLDFGKRSYKELKEVARVNENISSPLLRDTFWRCPLSVGFGEVIVVDV